MAGNKCNELSSKVLSESSAEEELLDTPNQHETKLDFFRHWAQWSGVMDANGIYWKECYPESEPLNDGEDDGSIDWGGNFYGGCSYHNDGDW